MMNTLLNIVGWVCLIASMIVIHYADEIYNAGDSDISSPELIAIRATVGMILGMFVIILGERIKK